MKRVGVALGVALAVMLAIGAFAAPQADMPGRNSRQAMGR